MPEAVEMDVVAGPGAKGARRATGDPGHVPTSRAPDPDPEVPATVQRRRFSAEYRLRILTQADACKKPGEVGALLRREGLYSSLLTNWRRQRETDGATGADGPTGATGNDGTNGTDGATGATGVDGPTGATGNDGTNGADDASGATGSDGTNGTGGATGPTGADGATGADGPTGAAGDAEPTGGTGADGVTGSTGANRASGYEIVQQSFTAAQMPLGGTFNPTASGVVTLSCPGTKRILGGGGLITTGATPNASGGLRHAHRQPTKTRRAPHGSSRS